MARDRLGSASASPTSALRDAWNDTEPAKRGFTLTLAALGGVFLITLLAQLPSGLAPAFLRSHRAVYRTFWPQGWSFFADTADVPTLKAYQVDQYHVAGAPLLALTLSAEDAWGFGRSASSQLYQAIYISDGIPDNGWVSCAKVLSRPCLASARAYRSVNAFRPPSLCGTVAFVKSQPTASTPSLAADGGPGRVAVVELACTR